MLNKIYREEKSDFWSAVTLITLMVVFCLFLGVSAWFLMPAENVDDYVFVAFWFAVAGIIIFTTAPMFYKDWKELKKLKKRAE